MSPEVEKKMRTDKVCGKVSEIIKADSCQMEERIGIHIRAYLNRLKAEGKIHPDACVKVEIGGIRISYCDPGIPGKDGVNERTGQPHCVVIK
jgi:hypothetical protein